MSKFPLQFPLGNTHISSYVPVSSAVCFALLRIINLLLLRNLKKDGKFGKRFTNDTLDTEHLLFVHISA